MAPGRGFWLRSRIEHGSGDLCGVKALKGFYRLPQTMLAPLSPKVGHTLGAAGINGSFRE